MTKNNLREEINMLRYSYADKAEEVLKKANEDNLEVAFAEANAYKNIAAQLFSLYCKI